MQGYGLPDSSGETLRKFLLLRTYTYQMHYTVLFQWLTYVYFSFCRARKQIENH